MASDIVSQRLLGLFADILDYPEADIAEQVRECEAVVSASDAEAGTMLHEFLGVVEQTSNGELQEIYTAVFDLDADCHPYLGYQLFGEGYERSQFLLELKDLYRNGGFQANTVELPDRLSEVLRFLSVGTDADANRELLTEGLIPSLDKLVTEEPLDDVDLDEADMKLRELRPDRDPYRPVIDALRIVIEPLRVAPKATATAIPVENIIPLKERIDG